MSDDAVASGKWLWLVAGPNGAGKSTLTSNPHFKRYLQVEFGYEADVLDPDELARVRRSLFPNETARSSNLWAIQETERAIRRFVAAGKSIAVETVLSSDKYKPLVNAAKQAGFRVGLFYIALPDPEASFARVKMRVEKGGHGVPPDRILNRFHRSLDNLVWFAREAERFFIYFSGRGSLEHVATGARGRVIWHSPEVVPDIVRRFDDNGIALSGQELGFGAPHLKK